MKKILLAFLVASLVIPHCGCVSQSEYDELEQRVAALESQCLTASDETVTSETEVDYTALSDETVPDEAMLIVSLDGMSSSEIVDLIHSYTATPIEGTTDAEYMERFPSEYQNYSINPSNRYGTEIYFPSGIYLNTVYASSYVEYVHWQYTYNMDGTIHVEYIPYDSYAKIQVIIADYDTAVAVYEQLSEEVYSRYDSVQDVSYDSNWGLTVSGNGYQYEYNSVLGLSLTDSGYRLTYINNYFYE